VTCTGVHGANRLASNSLLEGLVFGARAGAAAIADNPKSKIQNPKSENDYRLSTEDSGLSTAVKKRVKRVMWERVGIGRNADDLSRAVKEFEQIEQARLGTASRNLVTVAKLVARAALWREESRGGHFREDFPDRDDGKFRVHSIQKLGAEIGSDDKINFKN